MALYFDADARENVKHYAKGRKGARYQAINTQNDTTLELRMFAATLTAREVKAALGLAAASIEYTRDLTVPDITRRDGWQWPAFAAWVAERPEFAPLAEELDYRGLGTLPCAC